MYAYMRRHDPILESQSGKTRNARDFAPLQLHAVEKKSKLIPCLVDSVTAKIRAISHEDEKGKRYLRVEHRQSFKTSSKKKLLRVMSEKWLLTKKNLKKLICLNS